MRTFTNLRASIKSTISELEGLASKLDSEITAKPILTNLEDSFDYYIAAKNVLKRRCQSVDWDLIPEEMECIGQTKRLRGMLTLLRSDAELQIHKEKSRLNALPVIGTARQAFPFSLLRSWAILSYDMGKLREPLDYLNSAHNHLDSVIGSWDLAPNRVDPFKYAREYLQYVYKAGRELLTRARLFPIDKGLLVSFEGYLSTIRRMLD